MGMILILPFMVVSCASFRFTLPNLDTIDQYIEVTPCKKTQKCRKIVLRSSDPDFVRSSQLPKYVYGAVIVAEDANFFRHHGIDWHEIGVAMEANLKLGRYARGASTLTQQLVKNAFLSPEKSILRKLVEIMIALRVEQVLSKEQILDYYLNMVQLGPGIHGFRDGARFYFGKDPKDLTPYQAALLAYFIPRPNDYGVAYAMKKTSRHRRESVKRILRRMVTQNYLNPEMMPKIIADQ